MKVPEEFCKACKPVECAYVQSQLKVPSLASQVDVCSVCE